MLYYVICNTRYTVTCRMWNIQHVLYHVICNTRNTVTCRMWNIQHVLYHVICNTRNTVTCRMWNMCVIYYVKYTCYTMLYATHAILLPVECEIYNMCYTMWNIQCVIYHVICNTHNTVTCRMWNVCVIYYVKYTTGVIPCYMQHMTYCYL